MPKMKTRKAVAKRFRRTGTGKIRRARAYRRHLLLSKSRKRKRNLRRLDVLTSADREKVERLLPY